MSQLANTNTNINPSSNPVSTQENFGIICQNVKKSSQSGSAGIGSYCLHFVNKSIVNGKNTQNFMSWICNANSLNSLVLTFESVEMATAYCTQHNISFIVVNNSQQVSKKIRKKSYTENFTNP